MQETQETQVQSLGWEDPMEEGTAPRSSILARRIPWTEEAWQATTCSNGTTTSSNGKSSAMELQRVRHY